MMKYTLIVALSFFSFSGMAQEMIFPATIHTNLSKEMVKSSRWSATTKSDVSIELPFVDDFSVDHFPGNADNRTILWENRQASHNFGWPMDPPTVGAVSFDGADEFGYPYDWSSGTGPADTLTSCPINLDGIPDDGMGISFYYQPKGNAFNGPGATDSLVLEFYAPDIDQWFWAWSTIEVSNLDTFIFVYEPITKSRYLKDGFKFRFRNYARLQGALSTWNVDYIWVDRNETNQSIFVNDVAFSKQENTLLEGLTSIPRDHFALNPTSHMRDGITIQYRNLNDGPRALIGNRIRLVDNATGTEIGNFLNQNNPGIDGLSTLDYNHSVHASPNEIVYDPGLSATDLSIDVEVLHEVADFSPTVSNDTMRFTQSMFTHYAYDDGSAEAAYAVPSAGAEIAMRYDNLKNDSVFALQIYTMPLGYDFENSPFTIRIYDGSTGIPGAVLGETQKNTVFGLETYQQSIIYVFDEPIFVPEGPFYAGFQQSSQTEGIRVGLDFNTNGNPGNLFFREGVNWSGSQFEGSVMIRPMFMSNGYEELVLGTHQLDISSKLKVYPNPASNQVVFSTDLSEKLNVRVYDMTGRMIEQINFESHTTLDISNFQNGFYLIQFETRAGGQGVKKLVVNH